MKKGKWFLLSILVIGVFAGGLGLASYTQAHTGNEGIMQMMQNSDIGNATEHIHNNGMDNMTEHMHSSGMDNMMDHMSQMDMNKMMDMMHSSNGEEMMEACQTFMEIHKIK